MITQHLLHSFSEVDAGSNERVGLRRPRHVSHEHYEHILWSVWMRDEEEVVLVPLT